MLPSVFLRMCDLLCMYTEDTSLSDMLEAAGYDQDKYGDTPHIFTEPQMEAMYMSIITDALNATGIGHSFQKAPQNTSFDFVATLNDRPAGITKWFFDCVLNTDANRLWHTVNVKLVQMFFKGNIGKDTKVSVVLNNETMHHAFLKLDYGILKTHSSIILVDIDKMILLNETPLQTALPLAVDMPKLIAQN